MEEEGWRKPTLGTKTPRRTEGPQGTDKTRKQFRGVSETEGGQTTRLDADDIVNRQTTSRQTQTGRQRDGQADVEERN
jgi:hypothetical protein